MHKQSVKLNDVSHDFNFQRKFNLCNAYNTIEGTNFVENAAFM